MTDNNFNVLRLCAAWLVLFGHAFVFLGLHEPLFLGWLPYGPLAVYIFFAISGYLITRSWHHDPNLFRYLMRRTLRVMPALALCVCLCIVILGPIVTTLPLDTYFTHASTRAYFHNIGLYITYYLPGAFEYNRVASAVNGSLWSLPVEFLMYLVVAATGLLTRSR